MNLGLILLNNVFLSGSANHFGCKENAAKSKGY